MELNEKRKSFWERPEGTTGMLTLAGAGVGAYFALPFLLTFFGGLVLLLGQLWAIVAMAVPLATIAFLALNPKVQTLIAYFFKSGMRMVTQAFVEIDPIGIMKNYIKEMESKRSSMRDSRAKLEGQRKILQDEIYRNDKKYDNSMKLVKVARDAGNSGAVRVQSNQAGRMKAVNEETYVPLLAQINLHLRTLDKYYEVTGIVIEDMANEVDVQSKKRAVMKASYSAMMNAKKIMQGGTDQRELFDQAMEYTAEDFNMKMGAIDTFIENSRGFVEGLDLQNGVYEEEALARLKEWESKADDILLGTSGKQQLLQQSPVISTIDLGFGVPVAQQVNYSDLLRSK